MNEENSDSKSEPLFMAIPRNDPESQRTILDTQRSLHIFRKIFDSNGSTRQYFSVKARLTDGEETALIWLMVLADTSTGFVVTPFELPREFKGIRVGERLAVSNAEVLDWMVNLSGVLHGGFSLRYQRSKLPPAKHAEYDQYIGVTEYAEPDAVSGLT